MPALSINVVGIIVSRVLEVFKNLVLPVQVSEAFKVDNQIVLLQISFNAVMIANRGELLNVFHHLSQFFFFRAPSEPT